MIGVLMSISGQEQIFSVRITDSRLWSRCGH